MQIEKVINNNIVCSVDEAGRELVVMGRGLGFKVKEKDKIAEDKIEKIFRIRDPKTIDRFKELLTNMPLEHIQISNDVISHAKNTLNTKLNQNIYLTLTDHINFAIQRYQEGIRLQNALLLEIKSFYHQEFLIGEYAVNLINERLGMEFGEDEAGFIALHFVNAEYDTSLNDTLNITKLIQNVVAIVNESFPNKLDKNSLHYDRFVTHIKFLAQRIFHKELLNDDDPEFQKITFKKYPAEAACGQRIADMILKEYGSIISSEEIMYLAVHIRRATMPRNKHE